MKGFECADSRDKVYGILALVDWQFEGLRKPLVPNYTQDTFGLAAEVLSLIVDITATRYADWAAVLIKALKLSHGQKSVRIAIAKRQQPIKELKGLKQTRFIDVGWIGTRLRSADAMRDDPNSGDIYCRRIFEDPAAPVELVNFRSNLFTFAPPGTKKGDWLLMYSEQRSLARDLQGLILIVRKVGEKFVIVNQAMPSSEIFDRGYLRKSGHWRNLQVRWNCEDLLLMVMRRHQYHKPNKTSFAGNLTEEEEDARIKNWSLQRVCITEMSSYCFRTSK